MPKRNSTEQPTDVNQTAHLLVERSTQENEVDAQSITKPPVPRAVSRIMSKMGIKGGRIGGKRRLIKMTAEQRREVASHAATARWKKVKEAKMG